MKNQKGITLVALVITIIVLLILAGVSISLVLGQNGVLTQASNAVVKNNDAAAKQEIEMAVAACYTEFMAAWAQNTGAQFSTYVDASKISANLSDSAGSVVDSGDSTYPYAYKYAGRTDVLFKVDSTNGKVDFK